MSKDDIKLCAAALYENAIDGRRADAFFDSDFDRAENELPISFEAWLVERGG